LGRVTVIKLGGSIITDKAVPFKVISKNILNVAQQISTYGKSDLILIHGGGSVGHYLVKKLGIKEEKNQNKIAISTVIYEMENLTQTIFKIFLENNVPVVSLPTHSTVFLEDGKLNINTNLILAWLNKGFIPILKGDIIIGNDGIARVISGDLIAFELARIGIASRIVMCFSPDGIIGKDGKVIKKLSINSNFKELLWKEDVYDVTGGLEKKLELMSQVVRLKKKVYFINPKENRLLNLLLDKDFKGTELVE